MAAHDADGELRALVREWDDAVLRNDADAIGGFLADDWEITGSDGGATGKEAFLAHIRDGLLIHDEMTSEDVVVRGHGDAAVVTAHGVSGGTFRGRPFREHERQWNMFVREGGEWRCVQTHLVPLAPPPVPKRASVEQMQAFLDAFNRHDLDAIMSFFAEDCVFYMPRGAGPRGDRYAGRAEVRTGLAKRFEGIPDVHYGDEQHWACGDFGVSEWTLTGTTVAGKRIAVRGVDLLEFRDGAITRKDAFWKIVE